MSGAAAHSAAAFRFRVSPRSVTRVAVISDTTSSNLTAKEHELLEHLLRQPRRVFTRDQLLEGVWGLDSEAASNVVDVYVGYLRRKLSAPNRRPVRITTVRSRGYRLEDQA